MIDVETYLSEHDDWFKARKKPIIVLAMRLEEEVSIDTLEGRMLGKRGDFLMRGTRGEYYPVKPEIFHETYDVMGTLK